MRYALALVLLVGCAPSRLHCEADGTFTCDGRTVPRSEVTEPCALPSHVQCRADTGQAFCLGTDAFETHTLGCDESHVFTID
jgi:hypothetical protein